MIRAAAIFNLTKEEAEQLANRAGLSLCEQETCIAQLCSKHEIKYHTLQNKTAISERMFQYYMEGKSPTKQALLAILISMDFSISDIDSFLHSYGYCLSKSLPNDAVVSWFLINSTNHKSSAYLLQSINEVLNEMELPLLMTRLISR